MTQRIACGEPHLTKTGNSGLDAEKSVQTSE